MRSGSSPFFAVVCLGLALCPCASLAGDFAGHARLWVGPGFDSNARRDFVNANQSTAPDFFAFALGQLEGSYTTDSTRVAGAYDVGGRAFTTLGSEDTVLQNAQLEALWAPKSWLDLGLLGRARDRRGAERDYSDLQGGAFLDFLPDEHVDVRFTLLAHRFLYWDRFGYSWWGPDGQFSARYRFDRHHSISVQGQYNPRTYNATAVPRPDADPSLPAETRADAVFGVGLSYTYRGPFHLSVGYSYLDQTSNSFGETIRRHRFTITAGVRLPWSLTVMATGALQLASYPDGVYLAPELTVAEDDENASSVTLKLVRPLTTWLDLDLRYAFYLNVLPTNDFVYRRHVASLGLAVNW